MPDVAAEIQEISDQIHRQMDPYEKLISQKMADLAILGVTTIDEKEILRIAAKMLRPPQRYRIEEVI